MMGRDREGPLSQRKPRPTPPSEVMAGLARVLRMALELEPEDVDEGEGEGEGEGARRRGYGESLSRAGSNA